MAPEDIAKSGTEAAHQTALFAQAALHLKQYPELRWLHAIPNGGARAESARGAMIRGAQLKAQGVKAGVYDIFLPVRKIGNGKVYSGLYIEMKKPGKIKTKNKGRSEEQVEFGDFVNSQGFGSVVCDSWQMAWAMLEEYLNWQGVTN